MTPTLDAGNPESWAWVREWVAKPRKAAFQREWQATLLPILDAAIAEGLNQHFRAGQSMYYLLFSTAAKHGLESSARWVTLGLDDSRIFLAWSKHYLSSQDPSGKEYVSPANVLPTFKLYLAQLWKQTKAGEELPGVLA